MSNRSTLVLVFLGCYLFSSPLYVQAAYMGVYVVKAEEDRAVRIQDVVEHSPSQAADLRTGDIVTHVNEIPVCDVNPFIEIIRMANPGDEVSLLIMRGDKRMQISVRLSSMTTVPVK